MKKNAKTKTLEAGKIFILSIFAISCIYPMLWLVLASFKTNDTLYTNPWGIPANFSLINYKQAIEQGHVLQYFSNSVIIALSVVIIGVLLSAMVSYAITRMQWKMSKFVLRLFLLGMTIPVYAMIVPLFSMFNSMNLLNSRLSVIISHIAINFPIAIFILTGFMETIPRELEEASVIDGCNIFQIFFRVIMPVIRSSVVTVAVVVFIGVWNDLLLPQIFLTDASKMPLPVGLTEFQGQYATDYVSMIAAVVITVIPSIIVYILLHKNIMEGMVAGAVKG